MKNIKLIAFATVAGLFLTACGGGGGSSSSGSIPPAGSTPPATAVMVPSCGTGIANVTGKTIKKVQNGAIVKIIHSQNSTKTACMITGQAEII